MVVWLVDTAAAVVVWKKPAEMMVVGDREETEKEEEAGFGRHDWVLVTEPNDDNDA